MSDYTGALAAIRNRFDANWTTTPKAYLNEGEPVTTDINNNPAPWVFYEIISSGSSVIGSGKSLSQTIVYEGFIKLHVFVPTGTGLETGIGYAVSLGEIFRSKKFYDNDADGCYVRTWTPSIEDGESASDDGLWFRITASIPFEYWHRG